LTSPVISFQLPDPIPLPRKEYKIREPDQPSQATGLSKEQITSPLYTILRLTGHQKTIFTFILEKCLFRASLSSGMMTSQTLISITNTTLTMINTTIQRLIHKNLIVRENGKRGRGGYYCFSMTEEVKEAATEYKRLANYEVPEGVSDGDQAANLVDAAVPKELDDIDIDALLAIGFKKSHLVQLYKQGFLDLNTIQDSINHYAYDLQYNNKAAEIKKSNPIGYFMGILMRSGLYNPADNYESPKDMALRTFLERKKSEKEKHDQLIKELITVHFDEWQSKLSAEEKDELLPEEVRKSRLNGPKISGLKTYFIETIWPILSQSVVGYTEK